MRIANNIMAMNTHRAYTTNNDKIASSAEKLSSGYRINKAGDDAAGLAISEKMRAQIRGLNMAKRNSQDAISLIQTAEGALQEVHSMLQRMNELANQSATGTNETFDRTQIAKEFEQLKREINDISEQTTFNNMKILDGSLSATGVEANRSAYTSGIYSNFEKYTPKSEPGGIKNVTITPGKYYEKGSEAGFTIDLNNVTFSAAAGASLELTIGGSKVASASITNGNGANASSIGDAFLNKKVNIKGVEYTISSNNGGKLIFTADADVNKIDIENLTVSMKGVTTVGFNGDGNHAVTFSQSGSTTASPTTKAKFTVDLSKLSYVGSNGTLSINIGSSSARSPFAIVGTTSNPGITVSFTNSADAAAIATAIANKGEITIDGNVFTVTNGGTGSTLTFESKTAIDLDKDAIEKLKVTTRGENKTAAVDAPGFSGTVTPSLIDVKGGTANVFGEKSTASFDFKYNMVNNGDAFSIGSKKFVFGNSVTDPEGWSDLDRQSGIVKVDLSNVTSAEDLKDAINTAYGVSNAIGRPDPAASNSVVATVNGETITITYAGTEGSTGNTVNNATTNSNDYKPYGPAGDKYVAINSSPYNPKEAGKTTYEIDLDKLKVGDVVKWDNGNTVLSFEIAEGTTMEEIRERFQIDKTKFDGNSWTLEGLEDMSGRLSLDIAKDYNNYDVMKIQIGALEGEQLSIKIAAMNTKGLNLDDAGIYTQETAGKAITATREAINMVSDQRARLGAMQNRMNHKINNLAISAENLQAAESRIRDIDIAQEMTKHTQANILSQAATAMLAQANAAPQNVLSLLK